MKNIFSNKFFIIFTSILLISGGVLAFFTFDYNRSVDYQVLGSKGNLTVTLDLTDQTLNVSENLSSTQDLTIRNQNGATTMFYLLTTNLTGVSPACDPTGDLSFELRKGTEISNGTNFTMNSGFNNFNFTINAINDRVCNQNITLTLDFSQA